MPHFRSLKSLIRNWLHSPEWSESSPLPAGLVEETSPITLVNPLFACLTEGGETAARAAFALGPVMAALYEDSPEDAKNVVRRFMWHMNEESGNIGWGIPEAFAETLVCCRPLAETFHRVLLHYIYDAPEGKSTNYCDHAPLRLSCYRAVARLLEARPEYVAESLPVIRFSAAHETDTACRDAALNLSRKYLLTSL